tara:strand:+ start:512 stop:682 length:171 start_codon:yes stop_codon:yes gene_type:complete
VAFVLGLGLGSGTFRGLGDLPFFTGTCFSDSFKCNENILYYFKENNFNVINIAINI